MPRSSMWIGAAVHPHACGERFVSPAHFPAQGGPSPRLWGTHLAQGAVDDLPRSIPTPVGNAWEQAVSRVEAAVHPHACGERGGIDGDHGGMHGPSPRLWGTPTPSPSSITPRRSIPTPVGNARSISLSVHSTAVHPHACGERGDDAGAGRALDGPSPRLWGTRVGAVWRDLENRSIPTPVGNAQR